MRELSVVEQRYQAVLAVISDGLLISRVASKVGVSRQTLHAWLARYEAQGLEGLDRPRRLVFELAKRKVVPVPSTSAVYRALLRAGLIDPALRDRRSRKRKRWERGSVMELWQMCVWAGSR